MHILADSTIYFCAMQCSFAKWQGTVQGSQCRVISVIWQPHLGSVALDGIKCGQNRRVSLCKLAVFEWKERWKT